MTAQNIALELLRHRPMLALKPRRIALDVMARYGVGYCMAREAVSMAKGNSAQRPEPRARAFADEGVA